MQTRRAEINDASDKNEIYFLSLPLSVPICGFSDWIVVIVNGHQRQMKKFFLCEFIMSVLRKSSASSVVVRTLRKSTCCFNFLKLLYVSVYENVWNFRNFHKYCYRDICETEYYCFESQIKNSHVHKFLK